MKAFLKSLDEKVWNLVEHGWTKLESPFSDWTRDKSTYYNWNNKGLNAIFMTMSPDEIKSISICEIAKEAWDIFEVTYKGTKVVKIPNSKY
jgi:hypothetical protein